MMALKNLLHNPLANMSKPARYTVIAGGSLMGAIVLYRHHSQTGSWNPFSKTGSGTSSGGQGTDVNPVTGMAYSQDNATDPFTGMTYLQDAQQYGSVQAAESSVSAFGQSTATGSGIPVNPASPFPAGSPNPVVGSNVYTSNAAWEQAALSGLVEAGYDSTTVDTALGAWLTGQPLTSDQYQLVNTARGEFGDPPVAPPPVSLLPASGPSQVTTGSSGTSASPPPGGGTTGGGTPAPAQPASVSGGHVISRNNNDVVAGWTGHNAVKYKVTLTFPGSENGRTNTITGTTAHYSGLPSGHSGHITVTPYNSAGTAGQSGIIDISTT